MPMTLYDREQAFEAKSAHDEELRFLVMARRDKLFARWAATELGLSDEESEALVKAVVAISDGRGHDQALKSHVAGLLHGRDSGSDGSLSEALDNCLQEARKQLIKSLPSGPDARTGA